MQRSYSTPHAQQLICDAKEGAQADLQEEMASAEGFRTLVRETAGESQDFDEKGDWPLFLRNVKLPSGHSCVALAKKLLQEGEEEWSEIALLMCQQQAEAVLLPPAERQRRAEERRKRRIFMRAFPETLDGVTVEQVEAAHETVQRVFSAACAFGNLREKSNGYEELSQIEQDLRTQAKLLRDGGQNGVKIRI
ncbi:unnamed protein product [Prorocentrum cordatum]|uniref:Uncharacterized protein n=1 Tax=Prorocentrum cordatum TaxID=2364126 RepID=A0ABN9QAC0_9DINO|nr:unnamed protein product [Polarella glacialis]